MAEDSRRRHGAGLDFFDVGGADAAGGDFDEQFVGADARDGDGFEAQVVHAAIDDGAHGFGDVRHGGILTTDGHGWTRKKSRRLKNEDRIPKTDGRKKTEGRNPKAGLLPPSPCFARQVAEAFPVRASGFGFPDLFRSSGFGIWSYQHLTVRNTRNTRKQLKQERLDARM